MQTMDPKQAFSLLRRAGWQEIAIKRLARFRRTYKLTALDQAPLDPERLAFARWLVTTGRLTEQLPSVPQASGAPPREQQPWLGNLLIRLRGGTRGPL